MKLRQRPEDFIVSEVSDLIISKEPKAYKIYTLQKRGMETFALLAYLAQKNSIPQRDIGIAGLKDKHAVTKQCLSIPSSREITTLKEEKFTLTFIGYADTPIKTGQLQGNAFVITVRDIAKGEIIGVQQKAERIEEYCVPNYFDAQRFGSVTGKEFIGKLVVQRAYERAVKIYLTEFTRHENKHIKNDKKKILAHWGTFEGVNVDRRLALVIDAYTKTKSWLAAYQKIPGNLRELHLSAYQSYLWNECIRIVLRNTLHKENLYPIEYPVGSLTFYKKISEADMDRLHTFPLLSAELTPTHEQKAIIDKVLAKEGIRLEQFDVKETGTHFTTRERDIILHPTTFTLSEPRPDELNKNRYKITVSFTLPKGSYATIVTKRLFNQ